jgi:stearoyl-CoA desaturase (delta-9 desaturase)
VDGETAAAMARNRARSYDWPVILGIGAMHIGAVGAFFPALFTWTGLLVFFFFMWLTAGVGITLCYHRLLTHRSFKTPRWFEYILTCCGCLAWQGGPVQWVGVHRIHHAHSDENEDPHTPKHGFGWAHMFWCMRKESEGRYGADAAKDLQRDPGQRFLNKFFWLPQFVLLPILYFGGEWASAYVSASGLSWVVWGVFLRTVIVYHGTWAVNSAAHTWGYRNFETTDQSTNLWWVALLSFGEGWHNNHHAHPHTARAGHRWWEIDMTYWSIALLRLLRLATDVDNRIPTGRAAAVEE